MRCVEFRVEGFGFRELSWAGLGGNSARGFANRVSASCCFVNCFKFCWFRIYRV